MEGKGRGQDTTWRLWDGLVQSSGQLGRSSGMLKMGKSEQGQDGGRAMFKMKAGQ